MTKAEIKKLCEADDKLCWWAMVLFTEIAELMQTVEQTYGDDAKIAYPIIKSKCQEFNRLVIQRALEKAEKQPEAVR